MDIPEGIEDRQEALALRLVLTYSPQTHAQAVAEHAAAKGVKPIVIKRLLHKYAWFGMDKNALLNRDPFKGKVDVFTKKYETKTGRPNAAMVFEMGAKYEGRNVTAADIKIFKDVLVKLYLKADYTLEKTYQEMVRTCYYKANQYGFSPIRSSRIPTYGQFEYHARRLIQLLGLRAMKEGDKDGNEMQERRGYDTDISGAVGEVYDIDATPFNKELVCRYKVDGKSFNIGKATVLVVFDRDSKKAIGWHVYIGTENWKEGYRLALYCAFSSKTKHLKRLGIDDPTAFPDDENIVPAFVYVDGGPGASRSAQEALKRLRIDFKLAPPDTPYWKPTVEGGIGMAQEAQANDAGAYRRTGRARDKAKKRVAKQFAAETVLELEKKLVESLIEYNRRLSKKHLLTDEMKRDGVAPCSQAIFSWGVKKMGGVQNRRLNEVEVYRALLEHQMAVVTLNGVALLGGRYQSERLRAFRDREGKNVNITVMFHPLRLWEAYWVTPDGAVDELERDRQSNRRNGPASAYDIEAWNLRLLAKSIVDGSKKSTSKPNKLSKRQRDLILATSGLVPQRQRKRADANEGVGRKLEQLMESSLRPYDRNPATIPAPARPPKLPAAPEIASVAAPQSRPPSTAGSPLGQSGGAPHASGRLKTAELFQRRRAARQKSSGNPTGGG